MNMRDTWRGELGDLRRSSWPEFLDAHSGLPGPRANIELALAFADLADRSQIDCMIRSDNEYLAMCGAIGLGARATDPTTTAILRTLASDARWRIREAVAMGLQVLGDVDLEELERIVRLWAADHDPLVQRAAVAAICEPRLLRTSRGAALAVEVCRTATSALALRAHESRNEPAVRTLRQGLGYCWSVAVAADPGPGLAAFRSLDDSDPDVAWIIRENLRKKRLARLL